MAQLNQQTSTEKRSFLKRSLLVTALSVAFAFTGTNMAHASPNKTPPSIKAGAPQVYVVKKGDTLWGIAGKFLKSPWRWKEIWASNRHVKNPHWIYPGDRLLLCSLNGKPLIGKDEGDGCEGIIRRHTGKGTPQVKVESSNQSISVIPLSYIEHWLQRLIILPQESLADVPYVIANDDDRVVAGKGQIVYARGKGLQVGHRYAIYRPEEPYTLTLQSEKKFKKPQVLNLGVELQQMATAVVTGIDASGTATLELIESFNGEVRHEYYVLPEYETNLPEMFYPSMKSEVIDGGRVVRVYGGLSSAAKHSVVTIDRGTNHKMYPGLVFEVKQKGRVIADPKTKEAVQLPSQRVGHVMVFKTFENFSYAYVLDSELPMNVGSTIHPAEQ